MYQAIASFLPLVLSSYLIIAGSLDWGEAILHVSIVSLSITVLSVSLLAYARRRTRRYLLLSIGFFFLFLSQLSSLLEVVFLSNALIIIPSMGLHLSHVFDFLTLIFFILSMTGFGMEKVRQPSVSNGKKGGLSNAESGNQKN